MKITAYAALAAVLLLPVAGAQTLGLNSPMSPGPAPWAMNPEGWTTNGGTITVCPFGVVAQGTSGFATEGDQWAIVNALTSTGALTNPAGGPINGTAGTSPTVGSCGHIGISLPIPNPAPGQALNVAFDWNYVSPECANDAQYNDAFQIDLTDGAGTVLQSLLYRDTFSSTLAAPATTPEETGTVTGGFCNPPGTLEEGPIGMPKFASIAIDPSLYGNASVWFEVNVANGFDTAFSSYAYLDNLRIEGSSPQPTITLSSPGPGMTTIVDTNLTAGLDTFNVLSLNPCPGGPGTGPAIYLGLCAPSPAAVNFLLQQVTTPSLPGNPFHFPATSASATFGPYPVSAGVPVDAVCFQVMGTTVLAGPVITYTTQ